MHTWENVAEKYSKWFLNTLCASLEPDTFGVESNRFTNSATPPYNQNKLIYLTCYLGVSMVIFVNKYLKAILSIDLAKKRELKNKIFILNNLFTSIDIWDVYSKMP